MVTRTIGRSAALAVMLAITGAALAQGKQDLGKREYEAHCASCHGVDGKGGGPFVEFLRRSPPDLTALQRANGGVFPIARVYDVIEGAGVGHGTRDMPIWGQDYRIQAGEYYGDMAYNSEAFVRARILALAEYLSRLQTR